MSSFSVTIDACVLVDRAVADTMLRAAEMGLYRAQWSPEILGETQRTMVRLLTRAGKTNPERGAERLVAELRGNFPDALITGYEALIPAMQNDEGDRHVLAAAVTGHSQAIVTWNTRHFPASALDAYRIEVLTPDQFLADLFDLAPDLLCEILRAQAEFLTRPPQPFEELLDNLGRIVPVFIAAVRVQLARDSVALHMPVADERASDFAC